MTETKPYWIGGAKDGRFSCMLVPLKMDNEPLSTKQLHEIITAQNMTIDRLLDDKSHYMDVVQKLYDDTKVVEFAQKKELDRVIELTDVLEFAKIFLKKGQTLKALVVIDNVLID